MDEETLRRAHKVCPVTAIQNRYSMMARWYESLFPVLEELGVGFVAFSPLANGFLTAAYKKGTAFTEKGDYRSVMAQFSSEGQAENAGLVALLEKIAREKNATPAQVSLAWMLEKKPYIVPGGASNKLGARGYVSCAEEVLRQLFDRGLAIDHMVVPSGSAGTHAGIIAGMVGNNAGIPVTGIGVNRKKPVQEAAVLNLANETLEYIGVETRVPAEKVVAFDDYVGPGYSLPTDAMVEAVKMLARTEGILLDPVYSGKAMSGLIDLARKGYFPKGSNVLFLHTGGSPALYAYLPTFRA